MVIEDPIGTVEDAMEAALKAVLGTKVRSVETVPAALSPDEWGARLRQSPAVYVGFLGGAADPVGVNRIKGRFMAYIVTGNGAEGERSRRRGASDEIGAYLLLAIVISVLGNLSVRGVGTLQLTGEAANLFSEAFDELGVSVYSAEFSIGLSFPDQPDLSQYADFTTFHADIVTERPLPTDPIPLPDGEAAVESIVTLPNG
jgi:phage gp37-like protein